MIIKFHSLNCKRKENRHYDTWLQFDVTTKMGTLWIQMVICNWMLNVSITKSPKFKEGLAGEIK